jgi:hypothetical protein
LLEQTPRYKTLCSSKVERYHKLSQWGEQALSIYTIQKAYCSVAESFSDFHILSEDSNFHPKQTRIQYRYYFDQENLEWHSQYYDIHVAMILFWNKNYFHPFQCTKSILNVAFCLQSYFLLSWKSVSILWLYQFPWNFFIIFSSTVDKTLTLILKRRILFLAQYLRSRTNTITHDMPKWTIYGCHSSQRAVPSYSPPDKAREHTALNSEATLHPTKL